MIESLFVGRKEELELLDKLTEKKLASLVVITGRRRIGKSRLIEEFAKKKKIFYFTGLPPTEQTSAQDQRDEFTRQLGDQCKLPGLKIEDWGNIFGLLANQVADARVIILLDEISWMGSKDPTFLGKLKVAWDLYFAKNSRLMLILCGSVSSWIEKNILASTGFFGRVSLKITLDELSLIEANEFFRKVGFKVSSTEKFVYLSLTGGVPWYLELLNPKYPVNENIKNLCFEKDGILVDEFERIFHDLFEKRGDVCKKIVTALAKGPLEYREISKKISYESGNSLSEYLSDLVTSGFISRDYTWLFKSRAESRLSHFRLRDNYLRFYFRYILPNKHKIQKNQFTDICVSSLPGWDTMMGLQFENLVLDNRSLIFKALKIEPEDIVMDNPFFQRKTGQQKGCQIDYLIQTKYNTLYVCEIKFSRHELKSSIVDEVKEKISNLKLPRGFACSPVLIHVSDIHDSVVESEYFSKIIDFRDFLQAGS
jgi:AAA+ ATPase superfamily predicted ATPase